MMTKKQCQNLICGMLYSLFYDMVDKEILFENEFGFFIYKDVTSEYSIDIYFNPSKLIDPNIDITLLHNYFQKYLDKNVYSVYETKHIPDINLSIKDI